MTEMFQRPSIAAIIQHVVSLRSRNASAARRISGASPLLCATATRRSQRRDTATPGAGNQDAAAGTDAGRAEGNGDWDAVGWLHVSSSHPPRPILVIAVVPLTTIRAI
jgi:hypothetical protein